MTVKELISQISNAQEDAEVKIMLNADTLKDLRVVQLLSDAKHKQVVLSVDEQYVVKDREDAES